MIKASKPKITASVTIAPITPATTVEIPELPDEVEEEEPVALPLDEVLPPSTYAAQAPVLFPQALHHVAWSPMAILFISDTKVVYGRTVSFCPKSGYD